MDETCVRCTRCRRVSMAMTREQVEREMASFNAYYESLAPEAKANHSGPLTIESFSCLCGGTEFTPADGSTVPAGVTFSGVYWEASTSQ